jgi:hypothetical protein
MIKLTQQVKVREKATGGHHLVSGNPISRTPPMAVRSRSMEKADMSMMTGPVSNSRSFNYITGAAAQYDTLLAGLMSDEEQNLYRFYRDIYKYDPVAGASVDLLSTLPFSDFNLTGLPEDQLKKYQSSIERLNLKTLFPEISTDFLSLGKFVATLVFKKDEGIFTDVMPHQPENVEITPTPFLGIDPVLTVKQSDETRQFLSSTDRRLVELRNRLNPNFLKALRSDEMVLDPSVTLFLPRKTHTTEFKGASYFRRVLPIYLLEKTLYRGTLVEAGRRQRALVHLSCGEQGEWEPTAEELQAIVTLFQQTDLDPLGAIVATRNGVQPNELRQGGDFWKWTDIVDILSPLKLRALGISETFLSGEANYSSMEVSLSVFIENLRAYRDMVTQRIFIYKLFPLIAVINRFYKDTGKGEQAQRAFVERALSDADTQLRISYKIADTSNLAIPQVHWHKALKPEADTQYLEVLRSLDEQGLPIPMRTWAAAGGLSLETIEQELTEEKEMMTRIAALSKGDGKGGAEGEGFSFSTYGTRKSPMRNFLTRDYSDLYEVAGLTKTGKRKAILNQKAEQERVNLMVAKALKELADPHVYQSALKRAKKR